MKFKFTVTITREFELDGSEYGDKKLTSDEIIAEELSNFPDNLETYLDNIENDQLKLEIVEVK
jgi:hypothetical protein